jgi:hypothetical protein
MISPLAAAIAELLADPSVTTITRRIRPVEPSEGDAKGAGHYLPFVVLSTLDAPWQASTATSSVSLGLRTYAATYPDAEELYLACAAVFHRKGPRVSTSHVGIYNSHVIGGGTLGKDPDTQQPYAYGVIELNVSIQPV